MKRQHLFEFEDQTWLPQRFRNYLTDILRHLNHNLYTCVAPKMKEVMQRSPCDHVIDLCSGASGPWATLIHALNAQGQYPISITLTDKYPNPAVSDTWSPHTSSHIHYSTEPIDATAVPIYFNGFRTLFTCFHHFTPPEAIALLQDAATRNAPIGIFEFTERTWGNVLGMFVSSLGIFFLTPTMKPLTGGRLFWTYVIPLIPLLYCWDGIVSHLRTYTVQELHSMASQVHHDHYDWEVGLLETQYPHKKISYLVGCPEWKQMTHTKMEG